MEDKVTTAFGLMGKGAFMLLKCSVRATKNALVDLGLGAVKHPILALLIISIYVFMLLSVGRARAERDKTTKVAYEYQVENEQLEIYAAYD